MAALNVPSDGSDGALVISANTVIDLGQAVTGSWDANNTANGGKGVYDAEKWAVVFKYSSVTVASGATVSFKNHISRAPVVWLVNGNVTIDGTVSLDGETVGYNAPQLAEPGPGGFRGGTGNFAPGVGRSSGFGPGGAAGDYYGGGGSFGSSGAAGSSAYGNPSLLPLIGGSGGAGFAGDSRGGGAGGGAILIASSETIAVAGTIRANGGGSAGGTGGGSGGAVRLIAKSLDGSGVVQCLGGGGSNPGGLGRIRIERANNNNSLQVNPDPSVVTLADLTSPQIWMPATGPQVRIVSVGGKTPPSDPLAAFGAAGADVTLPQVTTSEVIVETTNVEEAATVKVRVSPRANGNFTETLAGTHQVITSDPLVIRWTASVPVNDGYSAMQVRVVRP